MVHQFGSTEDYDLLGKITKNNNWSWKNMRPKIFVVCLNLPIFATHYLIYYLSLSTRKLCLLPMDMTRLGNTLQPIMAPKERFSSVFLAILKL